MNWSVIVAVAVAGLLFTVVVILAAESARRRANRPEKAQSQPHKKRMTRTGRRIALGGFGVVALILGAVAVVGSFSDERPALIPLLQAVASDNLEDVNSILDKSPKLVNARFRSALNATPLHIARSAGMADLLLKRGANVNAIDKRGETPLDWTMTALEIATVDVSRLPLRYKLPENKINHEHRRTLIAIRTVLVQHGAKQGLDL